MPVLAITGQQARTAIGGHYQQEVDLAVACRTADRIKAMAARGEL